MSSNTIVQPNLESVPVVAIKKTKLISSKTQQKTSKKEEKMLSQYSVLTLELTKSLSIKEKKDYGIFITPKVIVSHLLSIVISAETFPIKRILEPSCGSCEFVRACDNLFTGVQIDAIELNNKIFAAIETMNDFKNSVQIIHSDFLKYDNEVKYDLIIGNPPYFVCKKEIVPKKYKDFCIGRPNIFSIFILHSLSLLNNGGILAFVVSKSFLNSLYYSEVRNYIKQTCDIISITDYTEHNEFIDTNQSTFGLVLRKKPADDIDAILSNGCSFSLRLKSGFIFSSNIPELSELFKNSTTLEKMGLSVRTGQIVWNEHKDELCDDPSATVLIYNTNISSSNKVELTNFKNGEKGQYINREGSICPTLVVNRGNGNSKYKLNYALILTCGSYLIENHLNEIYPAETMAVGKLLSHYRAIMKSFQNPKTQKFIDLFLGNNSLSKSELESIFPIYLE